MHIGIPKEIKIMEGRVGLIPAATAELTQAGHSVFVETHAGEQSGYTDEDYHAAGAHILPDAPALYEKARLIIKVKEPVAEELELLRREHILFSFLHLAANPALTARLQQIGLTAIAFETIRDAHGQLPLLAPMSDIAGRLATQIGCHLLHTSQGGKGLLLGGVSGAPRGRVTILGAGVAGSGAAQLAAALGAEVTVFDRDREKLERIRTLGANVTAFYAYRDMLTKNIQQTDLLIGAVLIPGAQTPRLVSADMVRSMARGSVIIDISVDQGGCIATTRPTSYAEPTFVWQDVIHFGVTNMPGAVPASASQALSAVLTPYVLAVGQKDWEHAPEIVSGINVSAGRVVLDTLQNT